MTARLDRTTMRGWNVDFSGFPLSIPCGVELQGKELLRAWAAYFPSEETLAFREWKVPSLVVCVDCVFRGGELVPYEIDGRPFGIGTLFAENPFFRDQFSVVRGTWPRITVVFTPGACVGDDYAWAPPIVPIEDAKGKNFDAVLVRAARWEENEVAEFRGRSICPVSQAGSKEYGVPMGLWSLVSLSDFEKLPWGVGFALKPLSGWGSGQVVIWTPTDRKDYLSPAGARLYPRCYTRPQIMRTLAARTKRDGAMYLQKFVPPMDCPFADRGRYMIYKLYWAFDTRRGEYVFLGGCWIARPSQRIKIRGCPDACFGSIVPAPSPADYVSLHLPPGF